MREERKINRRERERKGWEVVEWVEDGGESRCMMYVYMDGWMHACSSGSHVNIFSEPSHPPGWTNRWQFD